MPDEHGVLTGADLLKIKDWVDRKGVSIDPCPMCGQLKTHVINRLVATPIMGASRAIQIGGITYPHVMFLCHHCGYERLFNAVLMGLVPETPKDA